MSAPAGTAAGAARASGRAQWRDYLELCKPRVVALIVLTAVVGTLLATPGMPPIGALVFGNLGIALAAAAAARAMPRFPNTSALIGGIPGVASRVPTMAVRTMSATTRGLHSSR